MRKIIAYTDGSCLGNPGVGGYAVVMTSGNKTRRIVGMCVEKTTNNQMELRAVLELVKWLNKVQKEPCEITVRTDSSYLCTCVEHAKKDYGWLKSTQRPNGKMWIDLCSLAKSNGHILRFEKIKGHSGDTMNEMCDGLAKAKAKEALSIMRAGTALVVGD